MFGLCVRYLLGGLNDPLNDGLNHIHAPEAGWRNMSFSWRWAWQRPSLHSRLFQTHIEFAGCSEATALLCVIPL